MPVQKSESGQNAFAEAIKKASPRARMEAGTYDQPQESPLASIARQMAEAAGQVGGPTPRDLIPGKEAPKEEAGD